MVFIISIRKDIDNGQFQFPEGFDNGLRLKDLLEDVVDEKYYISQDKTDKLIEQLKNKKGTCTGVYNQNDGFIKKEIGCTLDASYYRGLGNNQNRNPVLEVAMQINRGDIKVKEDDICSCIDANYWKGLDNHAARTGIMQVGMLDIKGNEQVRGVYDPDGLSPTLNTMGGGNRQPEIIEDFYSNRDVREYENYSPTLRADRQGLKVLIQNDKEAIENISSEYQFAKDKCMEYYNKHGYLPEMFNPYNQAEIKDIAPTQTVSCNRSCSSATVLIKDVCYRIRKLTPLECLRLMGFDDEDYYILKENGISDSQIYKMAGNSIVVNVLEAIFNRLLI